MSSNTKIVVGIIVAIAVIGGIWYFWNQGSTNTSGTSQAASVASTTSQPTLSSGNSDQNLNSDLAQIDSQMNIANSDSAAVDQGFSDQPIQQAQY